jgi:hypothetical protein
MSKEMSPNFLAYLDAERQFQDTHQQNKTRRVKFEKVNEAWLVRFLPVGLGERNLWFVRNGQHWLNKVPIVCPQCVSPDFGGSEDAPCPVCELAEALNAESDDFVSTFGFKLRANITYLTYCLVYEIDPGRGDTQVMSESEILKPWEFQHYKSSFDELINYFRRGVTPKRPYSVLDLERGNDFWALKTTKGVRLDRQEPAPIFDADDAAREAKIDQIFNSITQPKIKIPTLKELETFARKAEAAAYGEQEPAERPSRGGRGEPREEEQESGERRRGGRSSRRMAAATDADEGADAPADAPAEEEDQVPGAEVPPRRAAAATAAAPVGRPVSRPAAAAPAAARPTARPATAAAPAAARPTAAARPVGRPAPAAASTVTEEEDPGVAEEATDPAGPAELPPEEAPEAGAEGTEPGEPAESPDQEEAPPAVTGRAAHAAPAAAPAGLRSRLMNRTRTAA